MNPDKESSLAVVIPKLFEANAIQLDAQARQILPQVEGFLTGSILIKGEDISRRSNTIYIEKQTISNHTFKIPYHDPRLRIRIDPYEVEFTGHRIMQGFDQITIGHQTTTDGVKSLEQERAKKEAALHKIDEQLAKPSLTKATQTKNDRAELTEKRERLSEDLARFDGTIIGADRILIRQPNTETTSTLPAVVFGVEFRQTLGRNTLLFPITPVPDNTTRYQSPRNATPLEVDFNPFERQNSRRPTILELHTQT